MPLYEYQCDSCGHRFEKIQKFSDPLVDKCPKCGSPVHKLISSPAIQFKGSGFYITDYPKNGTGAPKSSGGAKDKESSGSSESSSEQGADKSSDKGGDKAADKGKGSDKGSESKSEKSPASDTKSAAVPAAPKKD